MQLFGEPALEFVVAQAPHRPGSAIDVDEEIQLGAAAGLGVATTRGEPAADGWSTSCGGAPGMVASGWSLGTAPGSEASRAAV